MGVVVCLLIAGIVGILNVQQARERQAVARAEAHAIAVLHQRQLAAAKADRAARGGTDGFQAPATATTSKAGGAPKRIRIPAIKVNASIEHLGQDRYGALETPHYADEAGWFSDGVLPGQPGPAILVGHVDTIQGPAVFTDLRQLRPGNRIIIDMADGSHLIYRVDRSQVFEKALFPSQAVYGATPDAQLRIITCNEPFDRAAHTYTNNLVLFATLVD